ncbi:MAG: ATP-binding protein, partial [Thermoplasmata archaeon]|nr:ATP-binding protein [Thermoplasmata archaeon]
IKFPLKKREQALLHLLEFQEEENERTAPRSMTQDGISDGIGIQKKHVPRITNQLIELNQVTERKVHVPGKKQRVKAYYLTGNGWTNASNMKEQLLDYRVEISDKVGASQIVQLSHAPEILGLHLSFVELIKLVSGNIIDYQNAVEIDAQKKHAKIVLTEEPFIQPYFFGRNRELEELRELVGSRELGTVYVTGPSGIGKTSLMKKLGSELKIRWNIFSFRFDERTSLRGFLKGLSNFLNRIGCEGLKSHMELNISQDMEELILIIQRDIQNVEALLLLDNTHKMNRDITKFISRLIENRPPGLGLMFFGIDCSNVSHSARKSPVEIKLEGLDRQESISLLRHRGDVSESSFDMIYKLTSGNPLFLELINIENIPQEGDIHQYMREGLIMSLTEAQTQLLKLISTLRNPVTFIDILHMVILGQEDIVYDEEISDIIEVLVEKSLIKVKDQDTYETHDIVKNVFYSICTPEEKIRNHSLLASYYSTTQMDEPVLIEILYHYLKANNMEDFLELAMAQGSKLISKGYVRELAGLLNELDMNSIDPEERIIIYLFSGEIDFILGSWDNSVKAYKEALELIKKGYWHRDKLADCLRSIGEILNLQEKNEEALEFLNESLRISEETGDVTGQAFGYLQIGTAHWQK